MWLWRKFHRLTPKAEKSGLTNYGRAHIISSQQQTQGLKPMDVLLSFILIFYAAFLIDGFVSIISKN